MKPWETVTRVLSPKPVVAFKIKVYFSGCIPNENTTVGCVVFDKWECDCSSYVSHCSIPAASSSLGDSVPANWDKTALPNFGYKVSGTVPVLAPILPLHVLYRTKEVLYAMTVTMNLPGHPTDQLLPGVQEGWELVQGYHEDQLDQQNWAHTKPRALEWLSRVGNVTHCTLHINGNVTHCTDTKKGQFQILSDFIHALLSKLTPKENQTNLKVMGYLVLL